MARVIPVVLSIALTVFALADCIQTDEDRVRGIPRWAWIVLIVLVPWVGPLTWLLAGKDRGRGGFGAPNPRPVRRSGPLAPDEDPEFLRKLDEDIRRERRERLREQAEGGRRDGGEPRTGADDGTRGRHSGNASPGPGREADRSPSRDAEERPDDQVDGDPTDTSR